MLHLIQHFLSPAECRAHVKFINTLPLERTSPRWPGEAERTSREYGSSYGDYIP